MNIQGWFSLGLTGLTPLLSKGLSRVFFSTTIQKHQHFGAQSFYGPTFTSIHDFWKNRGFDYVYLRVVLMVKSLPAIQETQVGSLGQEDPLEKETTTYSNVPAWRILWTGEPGGLDSPWGSKESDMTERITHTYRPLAASYFCIVLCWLRLSEGPVQMQVTADINKGQ